MKSTVYKYYFNILIKFKQNLHHLILYKLLFTDVLQIYQLWVRVGGF